MKASIINIKTGEVQEVEYVRAECRYQKNGHGICDAYMIIWQNDGTRKFCDNYMFEESYN